LQLEQVDRNEIADRLIVGNAQVQGAEMDMPAPGSYRDAFDAALCADPVPESSSAALLRELGVA
jgi:hypothetical protein